jgi:TetR/AcrR family transcriptional regulator
MKPYKGNFVTRRIQNKEPGIKERISQEATQLFCEKGFGATSVSEIVEQAGVTKPVLYYYYGSKAALFDELFCDHFNRFHEMLTSAVHMQGSSRQKMLHLTTEQFNYCRRHLNRVRFIVNTVLGPQKGIPCVRFPKLHRTYTSLFSNLLGQGVEKGEIRRLPLEHLGMIYMGMIHMFLLKQLNSKRWMLTRNLAEQIVDVFFSGIGTSSFQAALCKEQAHV